MSTYLISYNIENNGSLYFKKHKNLRILIKELFPSCCHPLDSSWMIDSPLSANEIRDSLSDGLETKDRLLIVEVGQVAWKGIINGSGEWLRKQADTSNASLHNYNMSFG